MIATISPIFTSWPSAAFVSRTPDFSATISVETFSVSRVKSASPASTKSPDFLCQTETTPLEIDSPTAGIFTSMLMSGLQYSQTKRVVEPNVLNLRCGVPLRLRSGHAQLARLHLDLERFGSQARLLAFMDGERTDRRTGTGVATGVGDLAAEKLAQSRLDECPGAHVLRFFLAPDKLGGLWIRFDVRAQLFFSQWIKLLNPDDGRVVDLLHIAIVQKV